ncbi:MAG: hypothetical protein E7022_04040 [Desulfovibrio desulfuricans]|nr:hypothetical protein [Desulfovibrio desulfuricans]
MADAPESMTCNQNFKVSALVARAIRDDAAEAGQSTSEFLRGAAFFWGRLVRECPAVTDLNRTELAALAANVGKRLVIRPATVSFGEDE